MPAFICPLCRHPLQPEAKSWRCSLGHSFDVAREGYVNLLLVQQKKSLAPGDNPDMVRARREFLAAGHYQPLREAVTGLLAPLQAASLLDIGCGEGYYTQAMTGVAAEVSGLDIAKTAIQLAARRFPDITWLVGSAALLPLADAAVDVVCSLFSPLPVAEMARVLRPGGHLLVVTPAPRHLWTVRAGLFDEVRAHEPEKFLDELGAAFTLVERQDLDFPLDLDQNSLRQLLLMTPYVWKARPERRQALEALPRLATAAAFTLLLLRRQDTPAAVSAAPDTSPAA